jgi:hypothetical protein
MIEILLQIKSDSLVTATMSKSKSILDNTFFWISIIEFLIIIYLVIRPKGKNQDLTFSDLPKDKIRNAKSSTIDMDNLMNSINGSRDLYKDLSKVCHPDRFINTEKHKVAEEIFQEISKDKRNFEKLLSHKERAKKDLDIHF